MSLLSSGARLLGISPIQILIYAGVVLGGLGAFAAYRHSLINQGWDNALEAVKKQDTTAKQAASQAQKTVDDCYDHGGTWSVITGSCTETKP
jgi:hypothetical protein